MTSPVSMPAGHTMIASDFDAYENLTGVWTDFSASVSWTASGSNPAIGNGSFSARYMRTGKLVFYTGRILMGSTTTFGTGTWRISLPHTAASASMYAGVAFVNDASTAANRKPCVSNMQSTSTLQFFGDTGGVDATNPFTWATTDELYWSVVYEAA